MDVLRDLIAFGKSDQERTGIVLNSVGEFTNAARNTSSIILSSKVVTLHIGINEVKNSCQDTWSA